MERECVTQVIYIHIVISTCSLSRFYTGFEFSKRKFQSKYGQQVPIWALMASGSSGGVSTQTLLSGPAP